MDNIGRREEYGRLLTLDFVGILFFMSRGSAAGDVNERNLKVS